MSRVITILRIDLFASYGVSYFVYLLNSCCPSSKRNLVYVFTFTRK
ncbi:hypothetical protein HMPREF1576_00642 [Gardnerella pickettii JCP7719]|uniref:Uncharacterized protein n=1 Tax=Gardnerella pickettii JCP7719 TaxID=1261061 RepID=S4GMS1_9BIFI|nr:hypothetical protein HMPREF1576_00642 [Gardnerella pickettii JCP7719]